MMSDTHPVVGIQCPVRFIGVSAGEPIDEKHYAANPRHRPDREPECLLEDVRRQQYIKGRL